MHETIKAIGLLSGGLDSSLAIRLMQELGIETIGISCRHPFHSAAKSGEVPRAERVANELGIELVAPDVTEPMLALVKKPPHGHGRNLNPCIDCRILYLREGAKLMTERGASFLVTGEVLGQRPMSQRRDALNAIDRDAGLRGLVLRPLSARLLAPTLAEQKGWVDREKLLAIKGRGRSEQLGLARRWGLKEFSAPAGGCLLTNEGFAKKMRDLIGHQAETGAADVELLKLGRHFRLLPETKLVVGRNDDENKRLETTAGPADVILRTQGPPGPLSLIRGPADEAAILRAGRVMARYVGQAEGPVPLEATRPDAAPLRFEAEALTRSELEALRI